MTDTTGDELAWHESRPTFRQVPDWLLMHPDVSDGALRTWLVLAKFADEKRGAFPGVATIGKTRRKGRTVIFEHLDALERAGAIRRHARYRPNGGGRSTTLYVLAWAYPLTTMGPENRTHGPDPENEGAMSPENRTGPRPENRTPLTRTSNERKSPNPTAHAVGNQDLSSSATQVGTHNESKNRRPRAGGANPRAKGTNPRAIAQQAADAAARAERLASSRAYGARMASVDPETTADDFAERLRRDAALDRHSVWDDERIDAAAAGFVEIRAGDPPAGDPLVTVPISLADSTPSSTGDTLTARAAQIALKLSQRQP